MVASERRLVLDVSGHAQLRALLTQPGRRPEPSLGSAARRGARTRGGVLKPDTGAARGLSLNPFTGRWPERRRRCPVRLERTALFADKSPLLLHLFWRHHPLALRNH